MNLHSEHLSPAGRALLDRRRFLADSATALGSIALTNLLGRDNLLAAEQAGPVIDPARPYAPPSVAFSREGEERRRHLLRGRGEPVRRPGITSRN